MPILASFMVPHPPLIVPQVGRGSEKEVQETIDAYEQVAKKIAEIRPETIIVTSPHATMYSDYFHISPGKKAKGSFAAFRASEVKFDEKYDEELVDAISAIAYDKSFPAGTMGEREPELDHGTMVPLYFIEKEYKDFKLARIGLSGLPLVDHYRLGMFISQAVEKTSRRAVFVASGDLSHKLQDYGPYGFAKEGPEYDARIMDVMGRAAFGELLDFDEVFCDRAAECGHRSFVIMAGAWDGRAVKAEKLCHQDVTGVGYGICTFYPEAQPAENAADTSAALDLENAADASSSFSAKSTVAGTSSSDREFLKLHLAAKTQELKAQIDASDAYVRLARMTIEKYIKTGERVRVPEDLTLLKKGSGTNTIQSGSEDGIPDELLSTRAGAFVSIHKQGKLRGCIGTIGPTAKNLAKEIVNNAISASTRDPRFDPIREDELPWLEINVDVLMEPEDIETKDQLDVKRYGVIVSTRDGRRGILLPDIDGVDDVDDQVAIAMQKGGIQPHEKYFLQRFEVIRHR